MNVILKGRGVELNDRLRGYATEKFTRVQRFFERIIKMEVELSQERNPRVRDRHRVEVMVATPGETLRAHGSGGDYFSAIDQAADRLEVQVKKHKDRLKSRTVRGNHSPAGAGPVTEAPAVGPDHDDEGPRIVRGEPAATKPMTPEEAVIELEDAGLAFMLFLNAESMRCAVIYRRTDGRYGLIEHPA